MAKSIQPKCEAALGNLYFAVLSLQTQLDEAQEQVATLKAEIVKRDQTPPDPPASP